ncbi:MAG: DUF6352 family protein [Gemmobacter sp.]
MREFWVASGHHLTRLDAQGHMLVTDELILAWLARPEVLPPPEACFAERALHARLMRAPRDAVTPGQIAALADPDARENWGFLIALRDTLMAAGTIEAGYLRLVRQGTRLPIVFYDQLVQLILRNALDGCEDVFTLRAAEMFFRPQRAHFDKGAILLADDELVGELEAQSHQNPLMAMLQGGVSALDVLGEGNGWTYFSRSDAHTMVLPFGADPRARAALGQVAARFLHHLLGLEAEVTPTTRAEGVDLRWYVGLDPVGTRIGDALWRGEVAADTLIGLYVMQIDPAALRPDVAGHPVWLLLGIGADNVVRMKPQNLVMGLPLATGPEGRA